MHNVQERIHFFDTEDPNIQIKSIIIGDLSQPTVVMMHGLAADPHTASLTRMAQDLSQQNITTVRLFMYANAKNTRDLYDCTLETHTQDFERVVRVLRQQTPKLFALGHSYGGLTILISDVVLDGAILWDPSHGSIWQSMPMISNFQTITTDDIGRKFIVATTGKMSALPLSAVQYHMTIGDTTDLVRKPYPIKIITGAKSALLPYAKQYYEAAEQPKELTVLTEAGHGLSDTLNSIDQLSEETCSWLKNIL